MTLQSYKTSEISNDDLTNIIDHNGYIILEDMLDTTEILQLKNDLEPYFNDRVVSQAQFFGFRTKRIEALLNKSNIVQKMSTDKNVNNVVQHILGEHCDSYNLNLTQGIRINPNERAQILHPDSAMFPIENKPFEFMVNAIWAYSDFTKENGATLVVPGSHKWSPDRSPKDEEIFAATMKAGSVLIYHASLLHGGGANTSNESRTGIAISYCLGWLRQSENQYLSYTLDDVNKFSLKLQRLIGYNVHRPNLGWVHGHDPMDLLTKEDNSSLGAQDFLTDEQQKLMLEFNSGVEKALTSHNV